MQQRNVKKSSVVISASVPIPETPSATPTIIITAPTPATSNSSPSSFYSSSAQPSLSSEYKRFLISEFPKDLGVSSPEQMIKMLSANSFGATCVVMEQMFEQDQKEKNKDTTTSSNPPSITYTTTTIATSGTKEKSPVAWVFMRLPNEMDRRLNSQSVYALRIALMRDEYEKLEVRMVPANEDVNIKRYRDKEDRVYKKLAIVSCDMEKCSESSAEAVSWALPIRFPNIAAGCMPAPSFSRPVIKGIEKNPVIPTFDQAVAQLFLQNTKPEFIPLGIFLCDISEQEEGDWLKKGLNTLFTSLQDFYRKKGLNISFFPFSPCRLSPSYFGQNNSNNKFAHGNNAFWNGNNQTSVSAQQTSGTDDKTQKPEKKSQDEKPRDEKPNSGNGH